MDKWLPNPQYGLDFGGKGKVGLDATNPTLLFVLSGVTQVKAHDDLLLVYESSKNL